MTPGIIDAHSHLGVYASPGVDAHDDGNEATNPNTAEVWAEHSVWPQDPQFPLALAGGVTTMQILPGSANLIGGRGVTVKNVPARGVHGMKFPGAPYGLKMACGENPKRVYGEQGPLARHPHGQRRRLPRAPGSTPQKYRQELGRLRAQKEPEDGRQEQAEPPDRDLQLETLAGVLDGEILVQNHCYRADEMLTMIEIAKEFGYKIAAFHHAVEAYKIADVLAANGICAAIWADWWGFKMEAFDGIRENAALVEEAGACAVIHSDSAEGIQRLNQEAAKAMAAGNRMGMTAPRGGRHPLDHHQPRQGARHRPTRPARWSRARWPTSCSGAATRSASTAAPTRSTSTAPSSTTASDPALQPETDFELGLRRAEAAR